MVSSHYRFLVFAGGTLCFISVGRGHVRVLENWTKLWALCKGMPELSTIVHRGTWLGRLVNIKEANKQAEIYVGRSLTLHILFYA